MRPSDIVQSLDPPRAAVLKREERTLVWRERDGDGRRTVAKLYRKRGVVTELRSLLFRFRVEREFRRLAHLARWGVSVTIPLAWGHGWSRRDGFHELLLMKEVPGVQPLDEWLRDRGKGGGPADGIGPGENGPRGGDLSASPQGRDPHAAAPVELGPLFRTVREMHESGLCHQTLYAANVLVQTEPQGAVKFILADIPRSWVFPHSLVGTRLALWDLVDLHYTLAEAGCLLKDELVSGYGREAFTSADLRWMAARWGADPKTKQLRLRRDLVTRVRWVAAWTVLWWKHHGP